MTGYRLTGTTRLTSRRPRSVSPSGGNWHSSDGGNLYSILFWLAVGAIFAYAYADVRRFRRLSAER